MNNSNIIWNHNTVYSRVISLLNKDEHKAYMAKKKRKIISDETNINPNILPKL